MREVREVDAFVLPTIGNYSAYIDVDIDAHSREFGNKPHTLRINVYSPEELDGGELARITGELKKEWGRYIIERELTRSFYKWFKVLAPIEFILICGLIFTELFVFGNYIRIVWDIFFWGLILGLTGLVPGIRSLRDKRREDRAKQLLENWNETEIVQGTDEEKKRVVSEFRDRFRNMDGREVEIYEKLRDHSRKIGFKPAGDLYQWKIRDLTEEESFFTKHQPASWRRQLKLALFGLKVESPRVIAPIRSMDVEGGD